MPATQIEPAAVDPAKIEANPQTLANRLTRALWTFVAALFYRPSPKIAHKYRVAILKLFGADVDWTAHPYPKCKIWLPANLTMGPHSCLADDVDCYNVAKITIGEMAIVSQYSYLCSAGRDFTDPNFAVTNAPITIGSSAWIAAKCLIGPGVSIGEGTIVGAGSVTTVSVPPWVICAGNPCRILGKREFKT